ncbi:MAG: GTP-binding protein [Ruminococcaceae bacterium]|nr:GTP-binding protein [Oscillospiraceae bacterium]
MTKIDIFSGFLGAGKTTLIKKLISEGYKGEKLVLIENEFGEIGIDGGFLKEAGIQINEMNSGCICCSLVGDFSKALKQVIEEYSPDRILIEPSGVGKLSDVIKAVKDAEIHGAELGAFTTVADATKCKIYMKNFGEFYNDQIENASTIFLSRTTGMAQEKIDKAVELLREKNPTAVIVTTDWDKLTGEQMIKAMEERKTMEEHLHELEEEHKHHHHDHDEHCNCGCHDHEHHHHDHDEHEHHHEHHHDHDEHCNCGCHDHEHHHDHEEHDEHCTCGCHDHDHHHHHHADEVFTSVGVETTHKFTKEQIENILDSLDDEHEYGIVLRAKGIVENEDGSWIHFDYVPGCPDVREGSADIIGRICVIGSKIDEGKIKELFAL